MEGMKQANSVPANFGMKNEFRPNLGGGGAAARNSESRRSGRMTSRDFPGGSKASGGMKGK